MKLKILFGILLCLLMTSVAFAMMPMPINGKVIIESLTNPTGLVVEQTNLRTGFTYETKVDLNGHYIIDWANHPYIEGDTVRISIPSCTLDSCTRDAVISGMPIKVNFDITYEEAEDEGIIKEVYVYVCPDGTKVADVSHCPEQEQDESWKIVLGILSGLLALALVILGTGYKWGKGFIGLCNYYKKKGDEARKRGDYEQAAKYYERAAKMLSTAMNKAKQGLYDKAENSRDER